MSKIGLYLIIFGIGSIILNAFGFEFTILMWLGEGYLARIGIAVLGLILLIIGGVTGKEPEKEAKAETGSSDNA